MKDYYVYIWKIADTEEVFYIGKGKGNRYKVVGKRNKFFTDMYNSHICYSEIVYNDLTEKEAFEKEKELIKYYKTNFPKYRLTNQTNGGDGVSGWKPPKEFIDKQSKINKLRWQDEEYRNKIIAIRNDPNGIYKSEEYRVKMSNLVKGENNPNYNNRWSDEQKQHLSNVRKRLGLSKGVNNPKSKCVICIETGEIFEYITVALNKYNVKKEASMSVALNNKNRTCANYHWIEISNDNKEYWLNEENRFKYLIECLISSEKWTPYISVKTKQLFKNRKELRLFLNVGVKKLANILKITDEYIELKEYYSRTYK